MDPWIENGHFPRPHLEPPFLHGVPHGVVVGHEPVLELQAGLPPGPRAVPAMDEDVGERLEKLGLRCKEEDFKSTWNHEKSRKTNQEP